MSDSDTPEPFLPSPEELASLIDHTLLKPEATRNDIRTLCQEAAEQAFFSVCVNPIYVSLASKSLEATDVSVCSVVGFPLGAHKTETKIDETRRAIDDGAREIDMVLRVGSLREGDIDTVREDIAGIVELCHMHAALCKVILETCLLNEDEIRTACHACIEASADFVKTSTGFGSGGATQDHVRIMAEIARPAGLGVKASGGIRTYADALRMIRAGATRLGASSGLTILREARSA